jgi:hypothetical protein
VSGNALVSGNAQVYGDALVSGDARVYGDALVYGDARVYGPYAIAVRSDGHTFIHVPTSEDPKQPNYTVIGGGQNRSLDDYRLHADKYGNEDKKAETLLILNFLEAQTALKKWA